MWSKKRQLKKEEKESENFEEANKPEGKVKTNKKKRKRQFKIQNVKLKGLVIYLSISIVMTSGLTDQSLTSAPKVLQCQSSNRCHGFKSLLHVSLCRAEFMFKENSCGLIILINFLEKLLRETAETVDLECFNFCWSATFHERKQNFAALNFFQMEKKISVFLKYEEIIGFLKQHLLE